MTTDRTTPGMSPATAVRGPAAPAGPAPAAATPQRRPRRSGSGPRRVRVRAVVSAAVAAVALAGLTGLSAGAASAQPAGGDARPGGSGKAARNVPCKDGGWGSCDTRATDRGYQYRYRAGAFIREPIGRGPDAAPVDCGDDCPPDPAAICDLLLGAGPSPDMTPAELEEYNDQVAQCDVWLADNDAVPLADVQNQLLDYLRDELLPDPSVTAEPAGRSFANLPTLFHTPVPQAFTFPVDQPVLATITAVPHYRWDFGDHEIGPDAPGRPYDPALSPREHPDYYVSHRYREPGPYHVALTVTWYGSFTVPGVAQAFPLEPVALPAADDVVVQESVGVLTGND
jgi:hypothetical protein